MSMVAGRQTRYNVKQLAVRDEESVQVALARFLLSMAEDDQERLLFMMDDLMLCVPGLGVSGALELLFAVGRWMNAGGEK